MIRCPGDPVTGKRLELTPYNDTAYFIRVNMNVNVTLWTFSSHHCANEHKEINLDSGGRGGRRSGHQVAAGNNNNTPKNKSSIVKSTKHALVHSFHSNAAATDMDITIRTLASPLCTLVTVRMAAARNQPCARRQSDLATRATRTRKYHRIYGTHRNTSNVSAANDINRSA